MIKLRIHKSNILNIQKKKLCTCLWYMKISPESHVTHPCFPFVTFSNKNKRRRRLWYSGMWHAKVEKRGKNAYLKWMDFWDHFIWECASSRWKKDNDNGSEKTLCIYTRRRGASCPRCIVLFKQKKPSLCLWNLNENTHQIHKQTPHNTNSEYFQTYL